MLERIWIDVPAAANVIPRIFRKAAAKLGRNCFSAEVASFTEA